MDVRRLTSGDADAYRPMRLRGLQEHPEAFAASFEEERDEAPEKVVERLGYPHAATFGAFIDGQLVGIGSLACNPRPKLKHRAMVVAMYVAREYQGRGAGQALVSAIVQQARATDGVEDLTLAVTVGNEAARAVYQKAGFERYSIDPRLFRIGDRYYDVEWMILSLQKDE